MVQFEYNKITKRYDVKVPWQLADGSDQVIVGSISKHNEMTVHGELSLAILKQIIMHWDEYGELVKNCPSDLFRIKNFGRKSLTEVQEKLGELDLTLKQ